MRAFRFSFVFICGAVACGSSTTATSSNEAGASDTGLDVHIVQADARPLLVGDSGAVMLNPVGGPCADDPNCLNGRGSCMMPDTNNLTNGYCAPNCAPGRQACPPASTCGGINGDDPICLKSCTSDSDCRVADGYACIDIGAALALTGPTKVCWPSAPGSFACNFNSDCPPSMPTCTGGTGLAADPGDAGMVDDAGMLIPPMNFAKPGHGTCG